MLPSLQSPGAMDFWSLQRSQRYLESYTSCLKLSFESAWTQVGLAIHNYPINCWFQDRFIKTFQINFVNNKFSNTFGPNKTLFIVAKMAQLLKLLNYQINSSKGKRKVRANRISLCQGTSDQYQRYEVKPIWTLR